MTSPPAPANPWEPEVYLDREGARRLLERHFPDLAPARLEALGAGWDNTAWLVNGDLVFRFPRRRLGAECLEAELAVLPREALPAFEGAYGPVDGSTWRAARFRALTHGLNVLRYAVDTGDADLVEDTVRGLKRL